jgi:hypothetical protein
LDFKWESDTPPKPLSSSLSLLLVPSFLTSLTSLPSTSFLPSLHFPPFFHFSPCFLPTFPSLSNWNQSCLRNLLRAGG